MIEQARIISSANVAQRSQECNEIAVEYLRCLWNAVAGLEKFPNERATVRTTAERPPSRRKYVVVLPRRQIAMKKGETDVEEMKNEIELKMLQF